MSESEQKTIEGLVVELARVTEQRDLAFSTITSLEKIMVSALDHAIRELTGARIVMVLTERPGGTEGACHIWHNETDRERLAQWAADKIRAVMPEKEVAK